MADSIPIRNRDDEGCDEVFRPPVPRTGSLGTILEASTVRFLFNTVFYKPARGGGGPIYSVSALAEELVRCGHEVTVAASDLDIPGRLDVCCGREYEIEGVRVNYFRARPTMLQRTGLPMFAKASVFSHGPEFGRWLALEGPGFDVIDSQISFTCSNGACSRLARRCGKVYLYHQRGDLDPIRLRRHGRFKKAVYVALVEKPIMRRADALIALTRREVESFRIVGLTNRIAVIPNGIDAVSFQRENLQTSPDTARLLKNLGDGPVFLWMSRVHALKGPDIFVDAFIRAAPKSPGAHAIMAGPDEVALMPELLARVDAAGLAERFHYTGVAHGDDKAALFRRADCFVLPTEAEGFAMVLLEAMAHGCAVLTTQGAYFDEIQSVGAGKILGRTAADFAEGIVQMAAIGRKGMRELGLKGLDLVQKSYSWTRIGKEYESLCRELMGARPAKAGVNQR